MSGGSWDYLCYKIEEAADRLSNSKCPERRSLGELMTRVSRAMHDIEWVDSGDKSSGGEMEAIRAALDSPAKPPLEFLLSDARHLISQLQEFTDKEGEG